MNKLLLTLTSRIHVPAGEGAVPADQVKGFNAEIAQLGFTFERRVLEALTRLTLLKFAATRNRLLADLKEISGANGAHNVLFNGFPYSEPDQDKYLLQRIFGYMDNELRYNIEDGALLGCGHIIDRVLFPDLNEFGACPLCQFQVDELESRENVRHEFKRLSPLKMIGLADDRFLRARASQLLARSSSLSAEERQLLLQIAEVKVPDAPAEVSRENLPIVYHIWGEETARKYLKGATDILRIAVFLSDPAADLSLKDPVRFSLKTAEKKSLLRLLDGIPNMAADMMRHRERWLRLGKIMNPGTEKNRRRHPNVAKAFDLLRNEPASIPTFSRTVDKAVRAGSVTAELLATLKTRPGEFMRRLDFLLRSSDTEMATTVLATLVDVLPSVKMKLLFETAKYFRHRSTPGTLRTFMPKGSVSKMQVVRDDREPIAAKTLDKVVGAIETEIQARLAKQETMGKVYVSDDLKDIVMPFNRRGDSAGAGNLTKGSRYSFGSADVVRLFVHWIGDRIDVDLSVNFYDGNFGERGHISFKNLRMLGCAHSGDIQSAPEGATEFVDMEIDTLLAHGIRYAIMSLIVFRGKGFDAIPCFAGFMERDGLKSGQRYEPASVKLKFDVNSPNTKHLPVAFDFETRQVIYIDMAAGNKQFRSVDLQVDQMRVLLESTLNLRNTKPTVHDVVIAHARARGEIVKNPSEADISYLAGNVDLEEIGRMMVD